MSLIASRRGSLEFGGLSSWIKLVPYSSIGDKGLKTSIYYSKAITLSRSEHLIEIDWQMVDVRAV